MRPARRARREPKLVPPNLSPLIAGRTGEHLLLYHNLRAYADALLNSADGQGSPRPHFSHTDMDPSMYRTIFVGPYFEPTLEERAPARSLMDYALGLAKEGEIHLSIGVGSCKFSVPSAAAIFGDHGLIAAVNEERRVNAETFGADLLARTRAAGVNASYEIVHDIYSGVAARFVRMARVADLAVLQPSDETLSLMQALLEQVLFESGRPILVVPNGWSAPASLANVLVAWDGSAKAARAIGDALPFLERAGRVELVSISGDPDETKMLGAADIAPHLSRHCRALTAVDLPASDGDIGAVLRAHAQNTHASMIVMGAYGHSKIREFVLGGVTRSMLNDPPVPVLMSY
jgi:nucleotide-binding universal stress UspA family protein